MLSASAYTLLDLHNSLYDVLSLILTNILISLNILTVKPDAKLKSAKV